MRTRPRPLLLALAVVLAGLALAAPRASRARPRRYRVLIAAGARSQAKARRRLAALRVPEGVVLARGYPRLVASASVPGLHPGFQVVVLGFCPIRPDREIAVGDGSHMRFSFVDHRLLLAQLQKALPGTYARTVRQGDDSCPLYRGPRPDPGTPARQAWTRLAAHPGDVQALLTLGAWHEHALGRFEVADYLYSRALARDPGSAAAQAALARLQFLGMRPGQTPSP